MLARHHSFRPAASVRPRQCGDQAPDNKWGRENDYRLIKERWGLRQNRIAVRFAYEWRSDAGQWFRAYGNENWLFDEEGLMAEHHASINDLAIEESERKSPANWYASLSDRNVNAWLPRSVTTSRTG
ncbi:DUF1348 family protein [Kribbella sp. GL6]|uniref:DUF1348 family protein n=1 Tax=Kribbella sp. GL6 TaxID=3419765 RepID=UPI003CFE9807